MINSKRFFVMMKGILVSEKKRGKVQMDKRDGFKTGFAERGLQGQGYDRQAAQRDECTALLNSETKIHGPFPNENNNVYRGAVIGLENGYADELRITGKDGVKRTYDVLNVYCYVNDTVYDDINGFTGEPLYEYITRLENENPRLRMDRAMFIGTPWSEEAAELFNRLLQKE